MPPTPGVGGASRPDAMASVRSVAAATLARWETTRVVRPAMNGASAASTSRSVSTSRFAVASSRIRIGASLMIARAIASR